MEIEIGKLIGNIGIAVQQAQLALEQNSEHAFLQYFDTAQISPEPLLATALGEDMDQELPQPITEIKPKLHYFNLPQTDNTDLLAVPAVTLVNHSSLALDKVKIKLNVSATIKKDLFFVNVEAAPKEDGAGMPLVHEVEIEFKGAEPAEGISRIQDSANQFL